MDGSDEQDGARGSRVDLAPEFYRRLMDLIAADPNAQSLSALGRKLGAAVGRKPFSTSHVDRFRREGYCTDALLDALCKAYGLPYPIVCARHPAEVAWFEAGQELLATDPEQFQELLDDAMKQIAAARARGRRRHH